MKFTISGRIPSKKNNKQIVRVRGKPTIIESEDHREWVKSAFFELKAQINFYRKNRAQFPLVPTDLVFTLYAPDKRKGDLSNKWESIVDLFVLAGIFEDDNWYIISGYRCQFGGVDTKNPRVEVELRV